MRKIFFTVVTILSAASTLFSAEKIELLLNSGHSDGALCIVKDTRKGFIFSGGKDGNILIWREEGFEPVAKLQVSFSSVRKIAIHPKLSQLALIESDGSRYSLSAWDWEKRTKLFSLVLSELPLIFQYSPQGTFLLASKTDWKSLLFFDSANGRPLPYFSSGFGIVSFLFLSSTENTLVSYTPSTGTFIYWNLKQGTRKQTVPSQPEMRNLTLYNERYAVGTLGDDLVMVDLVTGEITASYECKDLEKILTNEKTGEILTFGGESKNKIIQTWKFRQPLSISEKGTLYPRIEKRIAPDTADLLLGKGRVFLAGKDLSAVDFTTWETKVLAEANLSPISDVLPEGNVLHLVTSKNIFRMTSDFFISPFGQTIPKASFLDVSRTSNPFESAAFLAKPSPDLAYLWKRGEDLGEVLSLDLETGKPVGRLTAFTQPLVSLVATKENLYSLEKNGSIKIFSLKYFTKFFEYASAGFQSFAPLGSFGILAGQDSTEALKQPLVSINPATGETVAIRHPSVFLFFRIDFDAKKEKIYLLGLRKSENGKTETVLQSVPAGNFDTFTILSAVDSYDLDADLHIDESSTVFTTLGGGAIRSWNGTRWLNFESNGNHPMKMASQAGKLYAVNRDGSLSVWDKSTGKLIGDICIFNDGNWLAYGPSGNFLTSLADEKISSKITIFKDGKPLASQKANGYRLYLPEPVEKSR